MLNNSLDFLKKQFHFKLFFIYLQTKLLLSVVKSIVTAMTVPFHCYKNELKNLYVLTVSGTTLLIPYNIKM